jgi:spermidine synthase
MRVALFILGALGITIQAVFLREILAAFRGGELTIGAALLFWFIWTAFGSGILGRFAARIPFPGRWFLPLLSLYGVLGYIGIMITGNIPFLFRLVPGELVPYDIQFIVTALSLAPFNILGGVLFVLGTRALERRPIPASGLAFTLEAFGAAFAGFVFSIFLVDIFSNHTIALACPLFAILFSLARGTRGFSKKALVLNGTAIIILIPVIWLASFSSGYNYKGQRLLAQKETRFSRLRVTQNGEQITFYSDAATLFSFPDPERSEYITHLPMLAAPVQHRVLILGGGAGGVIDEVLKYPTVEKVTCIELDPGLFVLAAENLREQWSSDTRVETIAADGRAFLAGTREVYDVIIMSMPAPLSGSANRYYTAEFFHLVSAHLTSRGIFGFSLTGAEDFIPADIAGFLASIRSTLLKAFPSVTVLPGLECRFLASNTPGEVDAISWEQLEHNRESLGIQTVYVRDYFLRYTMSPERVKNLKDALDSVRSSSINSDTKPSGYFARTILQGNLDESRVTKALAIAAEPKYLAIFLAAAALLLIFNFVLPGRTSTGRSIGAAIVISGFTGISLQVLALLAYQSKFGFLYGRIALLTGSYMAGMALGGLRGTNLALRGKAGLNHLAVLQLGTAFIALLWTILLYINTSHMIFLESGYYIFTLLAGFLGGLFFPIADTLYRKNSTVGSSQGIVYGLDLAGASVGALIAASLIIPVLGMYPMLVYLTALNALAGFAIFRKQKRLSSSSISEG